MKHLVLLSYFLIHALFSIGQANTSQYDKALADSLGANDYGMKAYVLVILKTGSNVSISKPAADSLFSGHMKNINRLASEGKLVVSGPMKKNERLYRGIFILNVASIDDAKLLLAQDPAITGKLLDVEYFEWFGSAALPMYLKFHNRIEKPNL